MQADPLDLGRVERSRLVPDRVRNPEPAEIVNTRRLAVALRRRREAELVAARRRTARRRLRRAPSSTATSARRTRRSPPAPRRAPRRRSSRASDGSAAITAVPARRRSRARRTASAPARRTASTSSGSNCVPLRSRATPRAASTPPVRRNTSTTSARLISRELTRDLLALHPVRALAIPALVALPQALPNVLAETKTADELVGRPVVVLRQRLHRSPPVAHERQPDPGALDQRSLRPADMPEHERDRRADLPKS